VTYENILPFFRLPYSESSADDHRFQWSPFSNYILVIYPPQLTSLKMFWLAPFFGNDQALSEPSLGCSDVVKKPKLDQHYYRGCQASFECLDCSTTFDSPAAWKAHTSCISEAQKYRAPSSIFFLHFFLSSFAEKTIYKGPETVRYSHHPCQCTC
jgi:hypothetical protein